MLRKLIVVYNPRSSRHSLVQKEVIAPARKMSGWLVGKYAVKAASLEENAKALAKILSDGDLVIAAGGDGTTNMVLNAIMQSGKKATLGVLGYGNFNDLAQMLQTKRAVEYGDEFVGGVSEIVSKFEDGKTQAIWPLEVKVDDKHWRYAAAYVTVGLLAKATEVMDDEKVRKRLNSGHKKTAFYSLMVAIRWYLKEHKQCNLPAGKLNGADWAADATDYLAVNSPRVAALMRGGTWYRSSVFFGSAMMRLGGFWRMVMFGLRSIFRKMPLREVKRDKLEFNGPSTVEIQAEGEYRKLEGVKKIEVGKAQEALTVVAG